MPALAALEQLATATDVVRRVLLIWQDPDTRLLVKVGELEAGRDDQFTFRYLPAARKYSQFAPIAQFPDLSATYTTHGLPEFFANRVMSPRRENYGEYISRLGLAEPAEPVEVLVRTGGSRATDTFHIVDDLRVEPGGSLSSRFFASGISHVPEAVELLKCLSAGAELTVRDEPDNRQNSKAVLMDVTHGRAVGYVPNWLLDDLHALRSRAASLRIVVDRVNTDAPNHLKLLCRLKAQL